MKQLKAVVLLYGFVFPSLLQAFIYEMTVLRKWNPLSRDYHYFVGLSDFHDKKNPANKAQLNEIIRSLKQSSRKNVKVLTEDLSCKGHCNRNTCGRFYVDSRGGVLGGLTETCKNLGVGVDNLEYRYCRVAAIGPVLNNNNQSPHNFASTRCITVNALVKEVELMVKDICAYDDGPQLKARYVNGMRQTGQWLKELKGDCDRNMTVADYIEKNSDKANRIALLQKMLTADSELLDLTLVHKIVNAKDAKTVVAIAGGAHVNRAGQMLQLAGYRPVYTTGISYEQEREVSGCLGSNVMEDQKGCCSAKPKPVSLKELSSYIR